MEPDDRSGRGHRRFEGDTGASLVEYTLLIALIALVCVSAVTYFQQETTATLSRSASKISTATEG